MRKALLTLLGIVLSWTIITIWVQLWDKSPSLKMTSAIGNKKALIVYNPDPIYNFDEQICRAFAEGLKENGYSAEVVTHKQTPETLESFDLLVFCANTYNWAPDWKITSLINAHPEISGKPCIAITLGAGSTERAKRLLEEQILARRGNLIRSETYWLLRPNDDSRQKESNVEVAKDLAKKIAKETRLFSGKYQFQMDVK